ECVAELRARLQLQALGPGARDVVVKAGPASAARPDAEWVGAARGAGHELDLVLRAPLEIGAGEHDPAVQEPLLKTGVPGIRRLRLERGVAEVAAQLEPAGRLEALPPAGPQH